jgi:Bacterial Ig domain
MLSTYSRRTFAYRSHTRPIAFDSLECRLAPAGDFGLAFHPGGPGGTAVIQAVTAPDGPVIVGYFTGTVNFNPSGTYNLTSNGGRDIFIASYDRMGRLQWAKDVGGSGNDQVNAVVTDGFSTVLANYGGFNIYLTGSFEGTVNFNPGGTADNLTAQGTSDAFVASFDSSGNFRWADDLGGSSGNDQGLGITYDSSSRPYVVVSGSFTNTLNFYPSIPTAYLQQPLVSAGGTDGFICKLAPDGTWDDYMIGGSTESWAEQIGGPGDDAITGVAAGGSNYYLTGYFSQTANLNPHSGFADEHTSAGGTDGFVLAVNSLQGYRQFLTTFGGPGDDQGTGVTYGLDSNNSSLPPLLFVGGSFQDTVDFSGGAGTGDLTSAGGSDAFVARYNAGTGALDWVRGAGGAGNDATNALAVAYHGVAAAGSYTGTANFAGPTGTFDLNDAGQGSGFLWSLDANGKFLYARGMGGSQPTQALGVAIGLTGYTFVGGQFQGTADFNQGFGGTALMTAAGSVDGFVAKFQDYFDMVPSAESDTFVYVPGTTLNVETTPGETLNSGFLADDPQRGGLGGLIPRIVTYPAHGTLSPGFYGDFTYTPNAGFTGTDSFTYQGADASLLSNVATVTLVSAGPYQNIEPIPNLTMYPGQSSLTVVLVGAEGGSQTIYSYSAQTTTQVPVTLSVSQYGVLTITPQASYSGTFGVTATVSGSSETFNVHVLANTQPTLPTIANQSTPLNTPLTLTLAATDPDEGGDSPADQTLTYSAAIVGSSPPVTLGITLNQLTITPASGYQGTFNVQASVTDGIATTQQTFQVTIGNSPTANSGTVVLPDDGEGPVTLSGSDAVTPPANLVFTLTSLPAQGTLSRPDGTVAQVGDTFTGSPTTLTYRLPAVVLGNYTDSFTYTATDAAGAVSLPATITLETPANSAGIVRVVGTPGADTIIVTHTTNTTDLLVTLNGTVVSQTIPLTSISQVRVFGLGGGDTIQVTDPTWNTYLDGGSSNSQLTLNGTIGADAFTIGTSSVLYRGATITAAQALTVDGLAGNDTFTITGTPTGINLVGGGGTDTVVATADTNFTLSNTLLKTAAGASVGLSGIGVAKLTSGSSNDTFDVSGWTGKATITGGGGSDTIAATKNANFTLTPTSLATSDKMSVTMSGITNANLTSGTSAATFTVSAWTGTGALTGGGGSNKVIAVKNADFALTNASLSTSDGMGLALKGIGTATLTGGVSNHTFTVSGWTGRATLSGGGGSDTVAAIKNSNFTLSNTYLQATDGMYLVLSGIATANLTGGTGNNTFTVSGWTGSGTLTGGGGTDTAFAGKAVGMTLTNSALTSTDGMSLTLSGIGVATLTTTSSSAYTIDASAFSGTVSLTAAGSGDGILLGGPGGATLTAAGTGNDILLGGTGKDTLKATGTGRDLLIGRAGADNLTGKGNAILISGTTSYDSNLTALDSILAEWASIDSYTTRISDITKGGGLNGSYVFNSSTVFDDLATNILSDATTSTGDWFLVNPRDKVTSHNGETVTVI